MAASCPECDGAGWTWYAVEGTDGEMETAYRICGCGSGTGAPRVCGRPECETPIPSGDAYCGKHWAEWDMNASAEAWKMAGEILESFAEGMRTGVALPELDEAMEGAITHARTAEVFYAEERDRIWRAS